MLIIFIMLFGIQTIAFAEGWGEENSDSGKIDEVIHAEKDEEISRDVEGAKEEKPTESKKKGKVKNKKKPPSPIDPPIPDKGDNTYVPPAAVACDPSKDANCFGPVFEDYIFNNWSPFPPPPEVNEKGVIIEQTSHWEVTITRYDDGSLYKQFRKDGRDANLKIKFSEAGKFKVEAVPISDKGTYNFKNGKKTYLVYVSEDQVGKEIPVPQPETKGAEGNLTGGGNGINKDQGKR